MSDMSAAIGLASFSSGLPPPKASACLAGMKDQVTASIMPRTASARRAARVRICSVVRIRPFTAAWLPSGCGRMLSTPCMRMTSSTRSALPSTSGRQDGTVTSTTGPEPETPKPSRVRIDRLSSAGTSSPVRRATSETRESDGLRRVARIADDLGLRGPCRRRGRAPCGWRVQGRNHELRVHAALEAVACVGDDAERTAGAAMLRGARAPTRSARRSCSRRSRNARRP